MAAGAVSGVLAGGATDDDAVAEELLDRDGEARALSPWVAATGVDGCHDSGEHNLMGDGIWYRKNDGPSNYDMILLCPILSRHYSGHNTTTVYNAIEHGACIFKQINFSL